MNKQSLVSICLLCYNHQKYIDECFASVIQQSYNNIEIIIVDDCSSDKSVDIVKSWIPKLEKRFESVYFIEHTNNMGLCKSANELIKNSKGKYIKLLATDDVLLENSIEIGVDFFDKYPQNLLFFANGYIVNERFKCSQKDKWIEKSSSFFQDTYKPPQKNMFNHLIRKNFIPTPTVMYQKTCFEKYGLYDENLYFEDYEYWLRITLIDSIPYINKNVIFYRVVKNSMCHSLDFKNIDKKHKCKEEIMQKYFPYVKNKKVVIKNFYKVLLEESLEIRYSRKVVYYIFKLGICNFIKLIINDRKFRNIYKNFVLNIKIM